MKKKANRKVKTKTPKKTKPRAIVRGFSFSKRRGRYLYDLFLKPGAKDVSYIRSVIESAGLPQPPDEQCKVTFVAKFKKVTNSVSYIFDGIETKTILREEILSMWDEIARKPKRDSGQSLKRMYKLRNYVKQVIIEFEIE